MSKTRAERREASQAHVASWQEKAMNAVQTRHQGHDRHGQTSLYVRVWSQFNRHLDAAAFQRGVTRASYVRRALVVALAHDLDMDPRALAVHCIHPDATFDGHRKRNTAGDYIPTRDDGAGIEDWCPHPGCDGSHLR